MSSDAFPWLSRVPCSFAVTTPAQTIACGTGSPEFHVQVRNDRGMRALRSASELTIANAYIQGDLDLEGDTIKAMWLRDLLSDRNVWLKLWRRLQPLLVGRERLNPAWIAKHYDSNNIQLMALDQDYFAYTPGIYLTDDDSLEESSLRKYDAAWEALGLKAGDHVLEVGCGWGGMTRYCASRGARVTSITLSKHQQKFTQDIVDTHQLDATVLYQDFFTFQPGIRFSAISCMGVIEDLSDYPRVMARFAELLQPSARAYLDFAAGKVPFATSSFITKYVWPGTFRMVYMPALMTAIDHSPMELVEVHNDRRNYYLWARNGQRRWEAHREEIIRNAGEETYRLFNLLYMGTAGVMSNPSQKVSAYRLVLERP